MNKICLSMIVKNEKTIIDRCLLSTLPYITSWCIIDTGSDDDTTSSIIKTLKDIPGRLLSSPWKSFGENRTELLNASKNQGEYLLLLDADMEIKPQSVLPSLSADSYYIKYDGAFNYYQSLLVKSNLDWKYIGRTHEYIHSDMAKTKSRLENFSIIHHCDGISRQKKFQRDIVLLLEDLKENPLNARAVFYLAQSYRDIGNISKAIEFYTKRTQMGGWEEEIWYSYYQIARMMHISTRDWRPVLSMYLKAFEMRPARAEPLYWVCRHYRETQNYSISYIFGRAAMGIKYPNDLLFIESWIYDYGIKDEVSISSFYTGKKDESLQLCEELLDNPNLPVQYKERILKNKQFCM